MYAHCLNQSGTVIVNLYQQLFFWYYGIFSRIICAVDISVPLSFRPENKGEQTVSTISFLRAVNCGLLDLVCSLGHQSRLINES
jgi:hypothetical protein